MKAVAGSIARLLYLSTWCVVYTEKEPREKFIVEKYEDRFRSLGERTFEFLIIFLVPVDGARDKTSVALLFSTFRKQIAHFAMKLNFELHLSISAPTRTSKINFLRIMELLHVPLKGGVATRGWKKNKQVTLNRATVNCCTGEDTDSNACYSRGGPGRSN